MKSKWESMTIDELFALREQMQEALGPWCEVAGQKGRTRAPTADTQSATEQRRTR